MDNSYGARRGKVKLHKEAGILGKAGTQLVTARTISNLIFTPRIHITELNEQLSPKIARALNVENLYLAFNYLDIDKTIFSQSTK